MIEEKQRIVWSGKEWRFETCTTRKEGGQKSTDRIRVGGVSPAGTGEVVFTGEDPTMIK